MEKLEKALRRARNDQASHAPAPGKAPGVPPGPVADALGSAEQASSAAPAATVRPAHDRKLDLVALDYANPSADLFRILRTQVLKALKKLDTRAVGVCSARAGEGKTYVATNLASSIALSQEWCALLIDLDLRRPGVHRHFGLTPVPGITDFLGSNVPLADCVRRTQLPGLEILTAGTPIRNSSEALGSSRLDDAFSALSRAVSNRIVVCDLPPLLMSDDTLAFSAKLGGIVFVVEEWRTRPADVQRSMELLASTHVIGTVLNKSKAKNTAYYYSTHSGARA
jgi:capsular exopolysaccharide synthesis family protein